MSQTINVLFGIGDINQYTWGNYNGGDWVEYDLVGRTTNDTFTNKTIVDPSNDVAARKLLSADSDNVIEIKGRCAPGYGLIGDSDQSAIWLPINSGNSPNIVTAQTIHVDKSGNDSSADGSLGKPFLTINGALSSISNNSSSNRYVLRVGPGLFSETGNIVLKPWVWIVGSGRTATHVSCDSGHDVVLGNDFGTGSHRFGLSNILISNNTSINLDLQSVNNVPSGNNVVFEAERLYVNKDLVWKARSTADYIEIWDSQVLGTTTILGSQGLIMNNYLGDVVISNEGSTSGDSLVDLSGNYGVGVQFASVKTATNFTSNLVNNSFTYLRANAFDNTLNIVADTASIPSDNSVSVIGATFSNTLKGVNASVTAGNGTPYQITKRFTNVTAGNDGDSLILGNSFPDNKYIVKNNTQSSIQILPPVGSSIDSLAINAAYTLGSGISTKFKCVSLINWQTY